MGLMPNVAEGLGISEPQVGNVISTYALGVVVVRRCWRSSARGCTACTCCCC